MTDVFISHAVADRELAGKLVAFLTEAIGVPSDAIFCSSLEGYGVPLGLDFNDYMKDQIQKPKLVVLLMTESYMERPFCLMELGAAWSLSHRALPIIVPPIDFSRVTQTLGLKQGWDITKPYGLVDLRKMVVDSGITLEKRKEHDWDAKRTTWRADLPLVIEKLPKASRVDRSEHDAIMEELREARDDYECLQSAYAQAQEIIERLKAAKDPIEVKTIVADASGYDAAVRFDELMDAISGLRSSVNLSFFRNMIMDRYDKARPIDVFDHDDQIEAGNLVQRNYAQWSEDGKQLHYLWGGKKLHKLGKAIMQLEEFLSSGEVDAFISEREAKGKSMDFDDLEFWEEHLS